MNLRKLSFIQASNPELFRAIQREQKRKAERRSRREALEFIAKHSGKGISPRTDSNGDINSNHG